MKTVSMLINLIKIRKLLEKLYQRENYVIQKQHGRAVPIICVLEVVPKT